MAEIKIKLEQIGETATKATMGEHTLYIDRPVEKGGGNQGPMGGQTLIVGIGGCFASTLFGAAISRNIALSNLHVELVATLSETQPVKIESIAIIVQQVDCSEPSEIDKLLAIAEKGCISINSVKESIKIRVERGS